MLKHLTISNFALVHQLDLSFSSAMTVSGPSSACCWVIPLTSLGVEVALSFAKPHWGAGKQT